MTRRQRPQLVGQRRRVLRIGVTEDRHPVVAHRVEVAAALAVEQVRPFAAHERDLPLGVERRLVIEFRAALLTLKSEGGTLTGTQGADGQSGPIFDGTVSGDDVAWKISITNPMPLTPAFTGKAAGDTIGGEMGIGPMGSFPFKGVRA